MGRYRILLLVAILVVMMPFANPTMNLQSPEVGESDLSTLDSSNSNLNTESRMQISDIDSSTGVLDSVIVDHIGCAAGSTAYTLGRNDVDYAPSDEVYLPSGHPNNPYTADCTGGYFLVGAGGSADFSSPTGTISLWLKWDVTAPHGRFWGQHTNFETRWSSNALVLDWGGDTSITGVKTDWESDHWYFISITWDETTNSLSIYWGDEHTTPELDASTSSWTDSVVGLHTENDIMNSAARTAQVDGRVDDFRYFSIIRNIENLTADYNLPLTGSEQGLNHYYRFDDDLSDSTGTEDLVAVGSYSFSKDLPRYPDSWRAEQVEVNVRNIKELYALNGTFDNGLPGTNEDWGGDGVYYPYGWLAQREVVDFRGRQRASYIVDDGEYVVLENEGYPTGTPVNYSHYNDTRIYWYQAINNIEQNEDFVFSCNYLYQSGPLGTHFEDVFELRFEIRDGSSVLWNWSVDVVNLTLRQNWYSVGPLSVNLPSAPTSFEARIVLEVSTNSSSIEIPETDSDLDGDSTNGMFVTVLIDDVSFTGDQTLSCESVDMSVTSVRTGNVVYNVTSRIGIAFLNYSSWEYASIPYSFSANTSISFEYFTKVNRMIRFYNSSFTTSLDDLGVTFEMDLDQSANLSLFTYIQSYPEAENLGFTIHHPVDWENASIVDPFGSDLTNQSSFDAGTVEVPSGVVDSVGWWIVRLNSPNYAQSVSAQKLDGLSLEWEDDSIFKSNEQIRCNVSIETTFENPSSVVDLVVTWYTPTDSPWASDIATNGSGHIIISRSLTIGPFNASTGIWIISAMWENGTEVAFGSVQFEIHHALTSFAHTPNIEAQLDENFTAAVYLYDQDIGNVIMSEDATLVGNWSGNEVYFNPNLAKGWWEADFNTTITGTGTFTIVVNATMQFYDMTNCTITVQVSTFTVLAFLGNQYVEMGLGYSYDAKLRYMFLDGTGINDAIISVLTWTGPTGGLSYENAISVPGEQGNYSIEFTPILSGTYFITVTGAKEDHTTAATSFYLIVGAVPTSIELLNGSSAVISAETDFQFTVRYTNESGTPLSGATLDVVNILPAAGVNVGSDLYHGNGTYSIILTPIVAGTFYLLFSINLTNHEIQYASFTLSVTPIASFLSVDTPISSIAIDRNFTIHLFFRDETLSGLENASISILSIYPSTGVLWSEYDDNGEGNYSITLMPYLKGTYEIVFRATLSRYQNGTVAFVLIATEVPTRLRIQSGLLSDSVYYPEIHQIILIYERTDQAVNITGAAITITAANGLSYFVIEIEGVYMISITPSVVGKWSLTIRATRPQYWNASIIYEFEVKENPTSVTGDGPPEFLYYNQTYSFSLWFGTGVFGIEDAVVNVTYNPVSIVHFVEMGSGFYDVTVRVRNLGDYAISIRFSKYGYSPVDRLFAYEIEEIPTTLTAGDLPDEFYELRTYPITLFLNSSVANGVDEADLIPSSNIRDFFSFVTLGEGWYECSITPLFGQWNVTIWLTKEGCQDQSFSFTMNVDMIPIVLSPEFPLNQTLTGTEGRTIQITLKPLSGDSYQVVSGATVDFVAYAANNLGNGIIDWGEFSETAGVYSTNITVPKPGLYVLNITIVKLHYQSVSFTLYLDSEEDSAALLGALVQAGFLGALSIVGILFSILVTREVYSRQITKWNLELLTLQGRLEDARNLIGILVIHSKVGLPIYSNIIKGGFEESMLSSFITAITHFRSEFKWNEPVYVSIPISEVIAVVLTETLICAVITVDAPTETQKQKLENFGRVVGEMYDDEEATVTEMFTTPELAEAFFSSFDPFFERFFDGRLLKRYVGIDDESLPGHLNPLKDIIGDIDKKKGSSPDELIKNLIRRGYGERRAHKIVLEAIDSDMMLPSEDIPPDSEP